MSDPGSWVQRRFGVRLTSSGGRDLGELVELALRRNPRRAHLLVSTVLGKHIPADPRTVRAAGHELGARVADTLGAGPSVAVLGFAETATGLGHFVAEALAAPYLHSTRRAVATAAAYAGFEEEHSHATSHRLLPDDPARLAGEALVLVDDELSTGRTAANTIAALHAVTPRSRYVIAALVDLRSASDRAALDKRAADLGVRLDVVALGAGSVELPEGFAGAAAAAVAAALAPQLGGGRVLVLGTEELMYAPTLIAAELAEHGLDVRVSSTTRSPVLVLDAPGYPIRSAISFPSHDSAIDGEGERYAYNVVGDFADIVVVVDADADTPRLESGLVAGLSALAARVHVVPLPGLRPLPQPLVGPTFGSYRASEVSWLLTDLSAVALEAPTEDREEAVQAGGAHYAESLPVEYQPDAAYVQLYEQALAAAAPRIAQAVGVVTELVLAEGPAAPVLVSLARAGTPVGILMRRWAVFAHGRDLPHHAASIVRGRGFDPVALRWLAERYDPAQIVFVDGWTGKGAIARELAEAVGVANEQLGTDFDPALAVLADPGACVRTFGTRDDFLVPSACLNSTVSGLVSRTVRNDRILAPGQFHGAKFYRALADRDVSDAFLAAISAHFPAVAAAVDAEWPRAAAADRTPTWAGWAEVERLSAEYGIGDVTLVKPGVGETTRVLLRRVPWAVLVHPDAGPDVAHVLRLAKQRGVPVHEVPGLTYRCVGLIHPRFTKGASGADGTAVTPERRFPPETGTSGAGS